MNQRDQRELLWKIRGHQQRCRTLPPLQPGETDHLVAGYLRRGGTITMCPARFTDETQLAAPYRPDAVKDVVPVSVQRELEAERHMKRLAYQRAYNSKQRASQREARSTR